MIFQAGTTVQIEVQDINDIAPVFLDEPYIFHFAEGIAG